MDVGPLARADSAADQSLPLSLSVYRVAGVLLFEVVHWRGLLFLFPNLFENWVRFVLVVMRLFPGVRLLTWRQCLTWLTIVFVPKLAQEYLPHVLEAQP